MKPWMRAAALREWRGLPEPPPKPDRTVSVGAVLEKLIPKLGLRERIDEEQIGQVWRAVVGEFLAAHSKPSALRDGVLYVDVLQPTVRYELDRQWKRKILTRLQEAFGRKTIREVRFRG